MLEKSEGLAVKKQLQTSSVLELQRDAIVIVSLEEKKGDEEDIEINKDTELPRQNTNSSTSVSIELSNFVSRELFGVNL